jgi:hypothetical protein
MTIESRAQVGSQTYIVKTSFSIKSVHSVSVSNVFPDNVLVVSENLSRKVLQMLANKWFLLCHSLIPYG